MVGLRRLDFFALRGELVSGGQLEARLFDKLADDRDPDTVLGRQNRRRNLKFIYYIYYNIICIIHILYALLNLEKLSISSHLFSSFHLTFAQGFGDFQH
jgi:hypothetical protein